MLHDKPGRVLLVGAGPGAADLLTVRALHAIENADVILFDALVGDEIQALFPTSARAIEVGKRGHRASTPQDFINRLMVRFARAGATVVRLKGGDPSIFGRVAEERAFLRSAGVAVEVVPGITTATAAAAEFGFSLTERKTARRVLFATGRTLSGPAKDWAAAADPATTLCLYMGCADVASITSQLVALGLPRSTPAIAALNVSRRDSQLIASTVYRLAIDLRRVGNTAPVFICIGETCSEAATSVDAPTVLRTAAHSAS